MKKILRLLVIAVLATAMVISCSPDAAKNERILEITVTGNYINENDGSEVKDETLKAFVKLEPSKNKSRSTRGRIHVNGFIMKGPFDKDKTTITLNILDGNLKGVELSEEIKNKLKTTLKDGSVIDFELPEIPGFDFAEDITANVNILTLAQARRIEKLVEDGSNYSKVYDQSKSEVLDCLGFSGLETLGEFNKFDVREKGDGNAMLLLASAAMAKDRDILKKFVDDVARDGKLDGVTEESVAKAKSDVDFSAVEKNLEGAGVTIPEDSNWNGFKDDDLDGIPNKLDVELYEPVGTCEKKSEIRFSIDPKSSSKNSNNSYIIEIFTDNELTNRIVRKEIVEEDNEYVLDIKSKSNDGSDIFTTGKYYYWCVKSTINGEEKILGSTKFYYKQAGDVDPNPANKIELFGEDGNLLGTETTSDTPPKTYYITSSRHITIDCSDVEGGFKYITLENFEGGVRYQTRKHGFELKQYIILPPLSEKEEETFSGTIAFSNGNASGTSYTKDFEIKLVEPKN